MKTKLKKTLAITMLFIVIFSSFYLCAFAAGNEISEVNITLPIPQTGEEIYAHEEILLDNENCRVGMIAWFSSFNGVEDIAKSDVFLPQYEYTLMIELRAENEEDYFVEDCVVKVNGEKVEQFRDDDGSFVLVEYNFGKPEGENFSFDIIFQTIKSFFINIKDYISRILSDILI